MLFRSEALLSTWIRAAFDRPRETAEVLKPIRPTALFVPSPLVELRKDSLDAFRNVQVHSSVLERWVA